MDAVVGLVGVVIGGFIGWGQTWWAQKKEQEKSSNYLAIRVVNVLRQYIYKCSLVAADEGDPDSNGELVPQAKDPGPIKYPDDIDWRSINPRLAYQLLALPNKGEAADRAILAAIDFCSGPPDYEEVFEERHLQYSMIGIEAVALERVLCKEFNLPIEETLENWNPEEEFQKAIKRVEESQIERAESHKKLMEEISASEGKK